MKFLLLRNAKDLEQGLGPLVAHVVWTRKAIRDVDVPAIEAISQRVQPLRPSGLPGVDHLATTDQAHDYAPVGMPVHDADEELWLRHVKVFDLELVLHELSCLLAGPRPLRFVENDHPLVRWARVAERLIPEVM